MLADVLRALKGYSLRPHCDEDALQQDLEKHLNSQIPTRTWRRKGIDRRANLLGIRGIPDIVSEETSPTLAIEVKYMHKRGQGGIIWSGLGQSFSNTLEYDHSILFIQTDVGHSEQTTHDKIPVRFVGEREIGRVKLSDIASHEWGIEIVWRDLNE